jgi:hypothetical protein
VLVQPVSLFSPPKVAKNRRFCRKSLQFSGVLFTSKAISKLFAFAHNDFIMNDLNLHSRPGARLKNGHFGEGGVGVGRFFGGSAAAQGLSAG